MPNYAQIGDWAPILLLVLRLIQGAAIGGEVPGSAGVLVVILMTPTFLQKIYNLAPALTLQANSLAIVFLALGTVVAGRMSDRFGAGWVLLLGCLGWLVSSWVFYHGLTENPQWLFPLYCVTGFFVGTTGAVPVVMVKAFPAAVRFSGLSFSYNIAYAIFGGLTPLIVTLMLKSSPMAPAWYVAILCIMGMVVGGYLLARRAE